MFVTIVEFVVFLVRRDFHPSGRYVIVYNILTRPGKSKEYAMVYVGMQFIWPLSRFFCNDWCPKSAYVLNVWLAASPCFEGCLIDLGVMCPVVYVSRV